MPAKRPDVYISAAECAQMSWAQLCERLDVREWDWRAEFERTAVTRAEQPPPLPSVEEYWLEVA